MEVLNVQPSRRRYSTYTYKPLVESSNSSSSGSFKPSQKRRLSFLKQNKLLGGIPISEVEKRKNCSDYMKNANVVQDAINEDSLLELEAAIKDAKASGNSELLAMVDKAEEAAAYFRKIQKYSRYVVSLNRSLISELHRYKEPKPVIYDVIKATFLLLGEDEKRLEKWKNVQHLMRRTGRNSIMRRVKRFDASTVHPEVAKRVLALLEPYDQDMVSIASAGAGTFYVWALNIATDYSHQRSIPDVQILHIDSPETHQSLRKHMLPLPETSET